MAYLSKFRVNNTVYDLKDAGSRAALMMLLGLSTDAELDAWASSAAAKALGDASWLGVTTSIRGADDASDQLLPSEKAVRGALAGLVNGTHFVGKTDPESGDTPAERLEALDPSPTSGDIAIDGVTEYIYDGTEWQKLGDESLWVPYTRQIAGIDLLDDITKPELATALELGNFAFTSTVTANVAGQTISGLTIGYTPAGEVDLSGWEYTTTTINSEGTYTPAGEITGTSDLVTGGTLTVTVKDSQAISAVLDKQAVEYATGVSTGATNVISAVGIKAGAEGAGYQVTGELSAPTVTAPTAAFVTSITSTAPSFTEGAFTAATLTTSDFTAAQSGVDVAVDNVDPEMLVFTIATTNTIAGVSTFDGGSKAADTFAPGSVAVKDTAAAVTTVAVDTPVFTGGYITTDPTATSVLNAVTAVTSSFDNVTGATYVKSVIDQAQFNPAKAANLGFSGTSATISVEGDYDKLSAGSATFNGTLATLTVPNVVVNAQTITVSAPAHNF